MHCVPRIIIQAWSSLYLSAKVHAGQRDSIVEFVDTEKQKNFVKLRKQGFKLCHTLSETIFEIAVTGVVHTLE